MNLCGLAVNERISGAWLDFHLSFKRSLLLDFVDIGISGSL